MKKGLSELVVTVLIVLVALAATSLVWIFLQPSFERTGGDIEKQSVCLNIDVVPKGCSVVGSNVEVLVQAKGGRVSGVAAVVTFDDGSTNAGRYDGSVEALVTQKIVIPTGGLTAVKAEAAAIIEGLDGELVICPVSAKEVSCGGGGGSPECFNDGDCDDGNECTENNCNAGICDYSVNEPDGTSCNDELWCSLIDQCNADSCLPVGGQTPCISSFSSGQCNEQYNVCTCSDSGDCLFGQNCVWNVTVGNSVCVSPQEICYDGLDNDIDGDADCNDPDCEGFSCTGPGSPEVCLWPSGLCA